MHSKQETEKLRVVWLQGLSCNGNGHSFLNLSSLEQLLEKISFLYHPLLPSTKTFEEIYSCDHKDAVDIVIFEGAYNPAHRREGYCVSDVLEYYAKKASHIVAVGSCASFGGIFKESALGSGSGVGFIDDKELDAKVCSVAKKRLINIPGCPVHPEWLGYVLSMIINKEPLYLDELCRPVELFSRLAHHGCTRNEYFEWKVDAKSFGLKEGCLFYEQGCRGPMTHALCNTILWNDVSSKTRAGTPCFGCTEPDFPRKNLFATKTNMSIPEDVPLGVSKRSYLTIAGIAKTFKIKRLEGELIDYKRAHRPD